MKKRTLAIVLALVFIFLTACGAVNVTLTWPLALLGVETVEDVDSSAVFAEFDVKNYEINEDDTITVTMSKGKYKEMLITLAANVEQTFNEMSSENAYPFIKQITHNDNFTEITVLVDSAGYYKELFPAFIELAIGINCVYYNAFAGNSDPSIIIDIIDAETREVIESFTY